MSNVCCWWCCHPFPGPSLHMPYKYDERTKRFTTTGHFCSWECAKTYALDMRDSRSGERQMFISLMRKHANSGKYMPTRCAPKRVALSMFGGTLTIDEFRHGSSNVIVTMPWETHIMPVVTTPSPRLQMATTTTSDDTLILKRAKPLARAKSSLEMSLGITRKSK
jgi:hypothetical protein